MLILFDPKYKLDSETNGEPGDGKPKKVDIDKMHAYRDAIRLADGDRVIRYAATNYPGWWSTERHRSTLGQTTSTRTARRHPPGVLGERGHSSGDVLHAASTARYESHEIGHDCLVCDLSWETLRLPQLMARRQAAAPH